MSEHTQALLAAFWIGLAIGALVIGDWRVRRAWKKAYAEGRADQEALERAWPLDERQRLGVDRRTAQAKASESNNR